MPAQNLTPHGLSIHPLEVQQHPATEALIAQAAPERLECVPEWTADASTSDNERYARRDFVFIESAIGVLGYGSIWPQGEGQFRMDLIVAPGRRNQGIGTALLERLLQELQAQKAMIVQARTLQSRPEALRFLLNRGFTETNRMIRLKLDVGPASLNGMKELTSRLAAEGITVTTLESEQRRTGDCSEKGYALIRAANPGRADPYRTGAGREFCSVEEARRTWNGYLPHAPDAFFIARYGEEYVGLSYLFDVDSTNVAHQGDTAVHSDWRRKGIAQLLKLHTIAYARQHGIDAICTSTASPGMLALNEQLGFRRMWEEIRLVRKLQNNGKEHTWR